MSTRPKADPSTADMRLPVHPTSADAPPASCRTTLQDARLSLARLYIRRLGSLLKPSERTQGTVWTDMCSRPQPRVQRGSRILPTAASLIVLSGLSPADSAIQRLNPQSPSLARERLRTALPFSQRRSFVENSTSYALGVPIPNTNDLCSSHHLQ